MASSNSSDKTEIPIDPMNRTNVTSATNPLDFAKITDPELLSSSTMPTETESPQTSSKAAMDIEKELKEVDDTMKNQLASPAGTLNVQIPDDEMQPFIVGVSEDKNKRCRRSMEDAHSFVYNFGSVPGQGFFAVFDGHAGKHAADWCGKHFHEVFYEALKEQPDTPVPEVLNTTFHTVDALLREREGKSSGCTAIVAFLRPEERDVNGSKKNVFVLYAANVGDARAVLCRGGHAIRLSYDHKGSDPQEAKRITDAGGFVMNNRVNGVLAVTRSLGDSTMKEFVVGSPYTTETVLDKDDSFLILACDGLWDVCEDQEAVNLVSSDPDPQSASSTLLNHALTNFTTDNLSVMFVRFKKI